MINLRMPRLSLSSKTSLLLGLMLGPILAYSWPAFIVEMVAGILLIMVWKGEFKKYEAKYAIYKSSNAEYLERIEELETAIESGATVRVRVVEKVTNVSIPPHVMSMIASRLTSYVTSPGRKMPIDETKIMISIIEKLKESAREATDAARYRIVSYLPEDDKTDEPESL